MSCIPVHALYFVMISLIQSSLQLQSEACLNNGLFYGGKMSLVPNEEVPNEEVISGAKPSWANKRVFIFRMPPSFFKRNKHHDTFGRRGRIWMKYNTPCAGSQSPSACPEMIQNQHSPCLDTAVPCSLNVTQPEAVCPNNISTNVTGFLETGVAVNFTVRCRGNTDGHFKSKCNATENVTKFPVGVTKVLCTCRDTAGNLNDCSFKVSVKDLDIPSIISVYPNGTTAVNLPPEVIHETTDYRLEYTILNTTNWKPYEGTGQNSTFEEGYAYDFRIRLKYNDTHDHTKILKKVTIPCRDIEIELNVSSSSRRKGMASVIANWTFRNLTGSCSVTNQTISVIPMDLDNCTVPRDPSKEVETALRDDKRSYTRTKLRANTKYNVTLTVNTKFKSYNTWKEFRTRGTAPSAPPTEISASSNTRARQLDIRWNKPPCGKRNSKIQSYKVEMQNRRGIEVHTFEGTSARYAGFSIGEEYVVRVAATNSHGSGPFSSKFKGQF